MVKNEAESYKAPLKRAMTKAVVPERDHKRNGFFEPEACMENSFSQRRKRCS